MKRIAVNPTEWSIPFEFNQGEVVEGHTRTLYCAGQTSIGDDGQPKHAGDYRAQATLALDNLAAVLEGAGMTFANVIRLTIYTTDVDAALANFDILTEAAKAAGIRPPQSLIGVAALAFPDLMIEIEATAVA